MLRAPHLPDSSAAAARPARSGVGARLLALLALLAAAPAPAAGDIYKWIDAQGRTVVSDVPPVDPAKVSGMKLLATGSRAAQPAQADAAAAPREAEMEVDAGTDARDAEAARRQQELEARIAELERQLQQRQDLAQAVDASGYYPPPPPPPPPQADNYLSYGQTYYPSYSPTSYYQPSPPAYTVVVVPARPVLHRPAQPSRHTFPPHPVGGKRPTFTGPAPQFTGRNPQFTGPKPQFTGPKPQFTGPAPRFVVGRPQFIGSRPQFTGRAPQLQNQPSHPVGPRSARR